MKALIGAKKIALCAVMTATIEIGKLVLSVVANVEVVSLLIAVYSYVFGFISIISVLAFILIELVIWGVQTWVLSYIFFFSLISIFFYFYGKFKVENRWIFVLSIAILTISFGFVSSFFDIAIGGFNNFFYRFMIYYLRGIVFYIVHVISNVLIFIFAFNPLKTLLTKIKSNFFVENCLKQ